MWEIYEKSAFNKNREQAGFGGTSSEYSVVRKAVACFRPKREAQVPDRLEERTEEAYSTIGGRDRDETTFSAIFCSVPLFLK